MPPSGLVIVVFGATTWLKGKVPSAGVCWVAGWMVPPFVAVGATFSVEMTISPRAAVAHHTIKPRATIRTNTAHLPDKWASRARRHPG